MKPRIFHFRLNDISLHETTLAGSGGKSEQTLHTKYYMFGFKNDELVGKDDGRDAQRLTSIRYVV